MDKTDKMILIAEDSPTQAATLEHLLTSAGYPVIVASNGKQAYEEALNHKFHLIISDIMMPEMNGYELCHAIKANPDLKRLPVLLLTSFTESNSLLNALKAGAEFFITKPYKDEVLLRKVESLINNPVKGFAEFPGNKFFISEFNKLLDYVDERNKTVNFFMSTFEFLKDQNDQLSEAEESLRELNQKLVDLNSTKDKLFSIIAHDLRSPFVGILGLTELLIGNIKNVDPATAEDYISDIHSAAKQTFTLLENLLAWAKTQTGQIDFKPETINLKGIVEEVVAVLSYPARIKNISLNIAPSVDIDVYADQNMLKTILQNLVSNAIKFTRPEGTIEITATPNHSSVEISVNDNGIGISDENKNKLFRLDSNVSTYGTADEKGSGLGLVLCKEFIEKHGGNIRVVSDVGKGSEFKIKLPYQNTGMQVT